MNAEQSRLQFYIDRDGMSGAIEFAKQTMKIYRKAVLTSRKRGYQKPSFASLPEYRKSFIESYLSFKSFLNKQEK